MVEHALRRINVEKRTAVCSVCGPVKVRSRGDGGWRCATALNEYKRRKRAADNEQRVLATELEVKTLCCGAPFRLPMVDARYARDGIISQVVTVWCACGVQRTVMRRHHRDGTDFLTWIQEEQVYQQGHLRRVLPREDLPVIRAIWPVRVISSSN